MFMRVEEVAEEARLKAASLMTSWGIFILLKKWSGFGNMERSPTRGANAHWLTRLTKKPEAI